MPRWITSGARGPRIVNVVITVSLVVGVVALLGDKSAPGKEAWTCLCIPAVVLCTLGYLLLVVMLIARRSWAFVRYYLAGTLTYVVVGCAIRWRHLAQSDAKGIFVTVGWLVVEAFFFVVTWPAWQIARPDKLQQTTARVSELSQSRSNQAN
jgi:hypothetical protein